MLFINFLCLFYLMVLCNGHTISKSIDDDKKNYARSFTLRSLGYTGKDVQQHRQRACDNDTKLDYTKSTLVLLATPKHSGRTHKPSTTDHAKFKTQKRKTDRIWDKFKGKEKKYGCTIDYDKDENVVKPTNSEYGWWRHSNRRNKVNIDDKKYIRRNMHSFVLRKLGGTEKIDPDTNYTGRVSSGNKFEKLFKYKPTLTSRPSRKTLRSMDLAKKGQIDENSGDIIARLTTEIHDLKRKYHVDKNNEDAGCNMINRALAAAVPIETTSTTLDTTIEETEYPSTAEIESMLNRIKQRTYSNMFKTAFLNEIVADSIKELNFNELNSTSTRAHRRFTHKKKHTRYKRFDPSQIFETNFSTEAYPSTFNEGQYFKEDSIKLADTLDVLQNELKSIYKKVKMKFSLDEPTTKPSAKTTTRKNIKVITKKTTRITKKTKQTTFYNRGRISPWIKSTTKAVSDKMHLPNLAKTTKSKSKSKSTTPLKNASFVRDMDTSMKLIKDNKKTVPDSNKMPKQENKPQVPKVVVSRLNALSTEDSQLSTRPYESQLDRIPEDKLNHIDTPNPSLKNKGDYRLSKRNPETLTNIELRENVKRLYDDVTMPGEEELGLNTGDNTGTNDQPTSTSSTYDNISRKISYDNYVNGYKHYLQFQRDQARQNFSNMIKYQAHRHHNVDDIGKFILQKIPPVPGKVDPGVRDKRLLRDGNKGAVNKSDDSWFKKHFYMFIDNGPPKKYHTAQTVSLKSPIGEKETRFDNKHRHNKFKLSSHVDYQVTDHVVNANVLPESKENESETSGLSLDDLSMNLDSTAIYPGTKILTAFNASTKGYEEHTNVYTNERNLDKFNVKIMERVKRTTGDAAFIGPPRKSHKDSNPHIKTTTSSNKLTFIGAALYENNNQTSSITPIKSSTKKSRIKDFFKKIHFKKTKSKKKDKRACHSCTRQPRFNPFQKIVDMFKGKEDKSANWTETHSADYESVINESKYTEKAADVHEMQLQVPNITDVDDNPNLPLPVPKTNVTTTPPHSSGPTTLAIERPDPMVFAYHADQHEFKNDVNKNVLRPTEKQESADLMSVHVQTEASHPTMIYQPAVQATDNMILADMNEGFEESRDNMLNSKKETDLLSSTYPSTMSLSNEETTANIETMNDVERQRVDIIQPLKVNKYSKKSIKSSMNSKVKSGDNKQKLPKKKKYKITPSPSTEMPAFEDRKDSLADLENQLQRSNYMFYDSTVSTEKPEYKRRTNSTAENKKRLLDTTLQASIVPSTMTEAVPSQKISTHRPELSSTLYDPYRGLMVWRQHLQNQLPLPLADYRVSKKPHDNSKNRFSSDESTDSKANRGDLVKKIGPINVNEIAHNLKHKNVVVKLEEVYFRFHRPKDASVAETTNIPTNFITTTTEYTTHGTPYYRRLMQSTNHNRPSPLFIYGTRSTLDEDAPADTDDNRAISPFLTTLWGFKNSQKWFKWVPDKPISKMPKSDFIIPDIKFSKDELQQLKLFESTPSLQNEDTLIATETVPVLTTVKSHDKKKSKNKKQKKVDDNKSKGASRTQTTSHTTQAKVLAKNISSSSHNIVKEQASIDYQINDDLFVRSTLKDNIYDQAFATQYDDDLATPLLIDTKLLSYDNDMHTIFEEAEDDLSTRFVGSRSSKPSSKFQVVSEGVKTRFNEQPKQYFSTPLPMTPAAFEQFLKEQGIDVESVTVPVYDVASAIKNWLPKGNPAVGPIGIPKEKKPPKFSCASKIKPKMESKIPKMQAFQYGHTPTNKYMKNITDRMKQLQAKNVYYREKRLVFMLNDSRTTPKQNTDHKIIEKNIKRLKSKIKSKKKTTVQNEVFVDPEFYYDNSYDSNDNGVELTIIDFDHPNKQSPVQVLSTKHASHKTPGATKTTVNKPTHKTVIKPTKQTVNMTETKNDMSNVAKKFKSNLMITSPYRTNTDIYNYTEVASPLTPALPMQNLERDRFNNQPQTPTWLQVTGYHVKYDVLMFDDDKLNSSDLSTGKLENLSKVTRKLKKAQTKPKPEESYSLNTTESHRTSFGSQTAQNATETTKPSTKPSSKAMKKTTVTSKTSTPSTVPTDNTNPNELSNTTVSESTNSKEALLESTTESSKREKILIDALTKTPNCLLDHISNIFANMDASKSKTQPTSSAKNNYAMKKVDVAEKTDLSPALIPVKSDDRSRYGSKQHSDTMSLWPRIDDDNTVFKIGISSTPKFSFGWFGNRNPEISGKDRHGFEHSTVGHTSEPTMVIEDTIKQLDAQHVDVAPSSVAVNFSNENKEPPPQQQVASNSPVEPANSYSNYRVAGSSVPHPPTNMVSKPTHSGNSKDIKESLDALHISLTPDPPDKNKEDSFLIGVGNPKNVILSWLMNNSISNAMRENESNGTVDILAALARFFKNSSSSRHEESTLKTEASAAVSNTFRIRPLMSNMMPFTKTLKMATIPGEARDHGDALNLSPIAPSTTMTPAMSMPTKPVTLSKATEPKTEESTFTRPPDESTFTRPPDESTVTKPPDESTVTKPPEETTVTKPPEETQPNVTVTDTQILVRLVDENDLKPQELREWLPNPLPEADNAGYVESNTELDGEKEVTYGDASSTEDYELKTREKIFDKFLKRKKKKADLTDVQSGVQTGFKYTVGVQNPRGVYRVKNVAALEVIVDLVKHTLSYEEKDIEGVLNNTLIMQHPFRSTTLASANKVDNKTNSIQVHIAIPIDNQGPNKRSPYNPVRIRKVFAAKMSKPVDLEYQVHSFETPFRQTIHSFNITSFNESTTSAPLTTKTTSEATTTTITTTTYLSTFNAANYTDVLNDINLDTSTLSYNITSPDNSEDDGLSPGMYLLVDQNKSGYALKPVNLDQETSNTSHPLFIKFNTTSMTTRNVKTPKAKMKKNIGKVTLSKDFVAAVNKQLIELYENLSKTSTEEHRRRKREIEEYTSPLTTETSFESAMRFTRGIDWDAVARFLGNDRVCNCKCKRGKPMCRVCAASDAVMDELIFELNNLGQYMRDHCTEIQTFFWMNPTGGLKLRNSVQRIDKSLHDYYKRVKGICQGRTCKALTSHIDKRQLMKSVQVVKEGVVSFLMKDLLAVADDLNKTIALQSCFNHKLKEAGESMLSAVNSCISRKNIEKRSISNFTRPDKSLYSLDNINVNIICHRDDKNTKTTGYTNFNTEKTTLTTTSTTTAPPYMTDYNNDVFDFSSVSPLRKNKRPGGIFSLFAKRHKDKLIPLYSLTDVKMPKTFHKRDDNYQFESPIIIKSDDVWNDTPSPLDTTYMAQFSTVTEPIALTNNVENKNNEDLYSDAIYKSVINNMITGNVDRPTRNPTSSKNNELASLHTLGDWEQINMYSNRSKFMNNRPLVFKITIKPDSESRTISPRSKTQAGNTSSSVSNSTSPITTAKRKSKPSSVYTSILKKIGLSRKSTKSTLGKTSTPKATLEKFTSETSIEMAEVSNTGKATSPGIKAKTGTETKTTNSLDELQKQIGLVTLLNYTFEEDETPTFKQCKNFSEDVPHTTPLEMTDMTTEYQMSNDGWPQTSSKYQLPLLETNFVLSDKKKAFHGPKKSTKAEGLLGQFKHATLQFLGVKNWWRSTCNLKSNLKNVSTTMRVTEKVVQKHTVSLPKKEAYKYDPIVLVIQKRDQEPNNTTPMNKNDEMLMESILEFETNALNRGRKNVKQSKDRKDDEEGKYSADDSDRKEDEEKKAESLVNIRKQGLKQEIKKLDREFQKIDRLENKHKHQEQKHPEKHEKFRTKASRHRDPDRTKYKSKPKYPYRHGNKQQGRHHNKHVNKHPDKNEETNEDSSEDRQEDKQRNQKKEKNKDENKEQEKTQDKDEERDEKDQDRDEERDDREQDKEQDNEQDNEQENDRENEQENDQESEQENEQERDDERETDRGDEKAHRDDQEKGQEKYSSDRIDDKKDEKMKYVQTTKHMHKHTKEMMNKSQEEERKYKQHKIHSEKHGMAHEDRVNEVNEAKDNSTSGELNKFARPDKQDAAITKMRTENLQSTPKLSPDTLRNLEKVKEIIQMEKQYFANQSINSTKKSGLLKKLVRKMGINRKDKTSETLSRNAVCDLQSTFNAVKHLKTKMVEKVFETHVKNLPCYKYRRMKRSFFIKYRNGGSSWDWIRNRRSIPYNDEAGQQVGRGNCERFETYIKDEHSIYRIVDRKKRDASTLGGGLSTAVPLKAVENELYVMVGDSMLLDCQPQTTILKNPIAIMKHAATAPNLVSPDASYTWKADRKDMLEQDNLLVHGCKLHILNAVPINAGRYSCTLGERVLRIVDVKVVKLPTFDVVFLPIYRTKRECSYDDLKAIQQLGRQMSKQVGCGHICSIRIDDPICQKDTTGNSTTVQSTAVLSMAPPRIDCSVQCRRDIISSLLRLASGNVPVLTQIPVLLSKDGVNKTLIPSKNRGVPAMTHRLSKKDSSGHHEYEMLTSLIQPGKSLVVVMCHAGFYLMHHLKICLPCPSNTSSLAGENLCSPCPAGTTSGPGESACHSIYARQPRYDWWWCPPCGYTFAGFSVVCACGLCMALGLLVHMFSSSEVWRDRMSNNTPKGVGGGGAGVQCLHGSLAGGRAAAWRPLSPSRVILERFFKPSLTSTRTTRGTVADSQETRFEQWKEKNLPPPLPPIDFEIDNSR